jgi:ABC-type transport system involved in multi-copper enzyme maturation permease subunit
VLILAFVFATLTLVLPVVLNNLNNLPTPANPDYVITTGAGVGSFGFFLFALVSVMNSISGEFESGSILPLLTKPVSRTTVYLGKIFAAFLTILGAYILLIIYLTVGGSLVYGPQNNLYLVFVTLVGSLLSTLVWMGIVIAAGSVSKSSMLAALLGLGIFLGLNIVSGIVSVFSNQAWILTYIPGSGTTAALGTIPANQTGTPRNTISAGT